MTTLVPDGTSQRSLANRHTRRSTGGKLRELGGRSERRGPLDTRGGGDIGCGNPRGGGIDEANRAGQVAGHAMRRTRAAVAGRPEFVRRRIVAAGGVYEVELVLSGSVDQRVDRRAAQAEAHEQRPDSGRLPSKSAYHFALQPKEPLSSVSS